MNATLGPAPSSVDAQAAWRTLLDLASARYRSAGRFAWRFARGKLGIDPVFRHVLSQGLIAPRSRVLDLGCGQGLLTSLLLAAEQSARQGGWPQNWAAAPHESQVTGIELMPRDVERAKAALGGMAEFICGDMRHTPFPPSDAVVMLDVLHYISVAEQDAVLARVRQVLPPGGRLLLRVGDASARGGFHSSQWVDHVVTFFRRHRMMPMFCRPLAAWRQQLESLGFQVETRPMSRGTPFANVLLVGRIPEDLSE